MPGDRKSSSTKVLTTGLADPIISFMFMLEIYKKKKKQKYLREYVIFKHT